MKKIIHWFCHPPVTGQSGILLIRLLPGSLFFRDGVMVFAHSNQGGLIAAGEIIGGILLIAGLMTRVTAFCCMIYLIVALAFPPAHHIPATLPAPTIFTSAAYAQMLTCLFLFLEGPGRRSVDFTFSTWQKIYKVVP